MSDSQIFKAAIKLSPDRRQAYLDEVCGTDESLRREVESLLCAYDESDSMLERPAAGSPNQLEATSDSARVAVPGTVIHQYKLMEQIGEGGMGVVYVAEQREPVHRKVALKIIKPGMDTEEVIARFEAKRQALALMDHPNIAKVFDAGATDSGKPFFVMELLRGIPITDYCDQNRLTTLERLALFRTVCHAMSSWAIGMDAPVQVQCCSEKSNVF